MHTSFLVKFLSLSYRFWYMLFHAKSAFTDVSLCNGSHTLPVSGQNLIRELSVSKNNCSSFLDFGGGISLNACTFLGSRLTLCQLITLPKKEMLVHLKRHLSLFSFKFACLHILRTFSNVAS